MPDTSYIINSALKQKRLILTEIESKQILRNIGINTTDTRLADSEASAIKLSTEIGFPVVLKIASPDITHKSDAGGVKVGLLNKEDVSQAYREIMKSCLGKYPSAVIEGVSVQNMAQPGIEIIMGMTKDRQFGPVLMFGLGGVWVEVLKDVSFRIIPIAKSNAVDMVREIKGFPLLTGYRGHEPVDLEMLEDILLRLSDFIEKTPGIKEMDINPLFAYRDSAVAVDARIVLEEPATPSIRPK